MKKMKVGLLWHSLSSDNLGVGALTLSQIQIISEVAKQCDVDLTFHIIGTKGAGTYKNLPECITDSVEFSFSRLRALDFTAVKNIMSCDLVFDIGEGDSFSDIYGIPRELKIVTSKVLSKLGGAKLITSPQTIGPFNTGIGRVFGRLGLSISDSVYTRDPLSTDYANKLLSGRKAIETIDVAFALPFTRRDIKSKLQIGINVSGLMLNDSSSFGLTIDYKKHIDECIDFFTQIPNSEIWLVPHVLSNAHEVEDDVRASIKVATRHPSVRIAPHFSNPSEAKSFISGLSFFTGARMHACIAAFSSGVPVIPMAYSRKFNGLFDSLDYNYYIDGKVDSNPSALTKIVNGWNDADNIKEAVSRGNKIAQSKLKIYRDGIATLLSC